MIAFPPLVEARLLRRDNRFRATALLDGQEVAVHVPNSGRMHEVFGVSGRRAWLARARNPRRKTPYDLVLVEGEGGVLISVDSRLPNRLFADALAEGRFDRWLGASAAAWQVQPEPRFGDGRLDFLLTSAQGPRWWIETKSITLVEDGVALFPDAPTTRGRRHLADLCRLVQAGERAGVVFVAQRED
ncbi:MAG: DNA/RNA nuclease SfsA, partial [Chloroflexi bacterium]|nr:DNA/RNA nuclease SfsA [Chloroflexota bacterium]